MDKVSMSAGGRVANIYMQRERQRKITSMMNGLEAKRLQSIKKQIEEDKATERHLMERSSKKIFQSNDDKKAFQKALLQRITLVKEKSKMSGGIRPLINLGRYGGATIDQLRGEAKKYKPIRNREERRLIKTKILLEQGRRNGQIKTFQADMLGDVTESILRLEKITKAPNPLQRALDIANLEDVAEADEEQQSRELSALPRTELEKVIVRRRRIVLPPLQVSRSSKPNTNYYRQISAQYKEMRTKLEKQKMSGALSGIPEEYIKLEYIPNEKNNQQNESTNEEQEVIGNKRSKSTVRERHQSGSRRRYYEWDYSKPLGPVTIGKYLSDGQKFWRPNESVAVRHSQKIVLPKIA